MAQAQWAYTRPAFPLVGTVFEMTMHEEITGLGMVKLFGYGPDGWRFNGATVPVGTVKKFKLVQVGHCRNLDEVRRKLGEHGKVPEGVWMQVFDETFGTNGRNPMGVSNASWVSPRGDARFPVVDSFSDRYFDWPCRERNDGWLWLVEVP